MFFCVSNNKTIFNRFKFVFLFSSHHMFHSFDGQSVCVWFDCTKTKYLFSHLLAHWSLPRHSRERRKKKPQNIEKHKYRAQQPKNVTNSSQITHLLFLKFIHTSAPSMIPPKWKTFINRFATLLVDGQRWNYHFFFSLPNVLGVIYLAALIRRKQLVLLITFDLFDWCARNSFVFVCTIYY